MFFYIDEAGNSGSNLFDANQPVLSYGVLSSRTNLDCLATAEHAAILRKLGCPSIHANKLGLEGVRSIAPELRSLQKRFDLSFDYYFIHKRSYATVTFFNAVFDAGLNDAVKWDWYWTPARFPLVAVLDRLLDDEMLKETWALQLMPLDRIGREEARIRKLLQTVLDKIKAQPAMDKRLREILTDALLFGIKKPLELDFGTSGKKTMSPNAVGFQFVVAAIAARQKASGRKALGITVDVQTEFNNAQLETFRRQSVISSALKNNQKDREWYLSHPTNAGVREGIESLISHFPERGMDIRESSKSIGLQVADVYLWITNRFLKSNDVPIDLHPIVSRIVDRGRVDGISVGAMMQRWKELERELSKFQNLTPEQMALNEKLVDEHREKVKQMNLG